MRVYFFIPLENVNAMAGLGLYCGDNCGAFLTPCYKLGESILQGETPVIWTDSDGIEHSYSYQIHMDEVAYYLIGFSIELSTQIIPANKVQDIRNLATFEGDADGLLNFVK